MIHLKNSINRFMRFLWGLNRPSKGTNLQRLRNRGEKINLMTFREATVEDLRGLAELHVQTWSETYRSIRKPTYQVREHQWREQYKVTADSWFCVVVENQAGKLVGFAKGNKYSHGDLPGFAGELNKIYLLREYQRLGLGRKLIGFVARKFLRQGIHSMVLFGTPQNPSCAFHEALGGEKLLGKNGEFHGGYGWRDVSRLAAL